MQHHLLQANEIPKKMYKIIYETLIESLFQSFKLASNRLGASIEMVGLGIHHKFKKLKFGVLNEALVKIGPIKDNDLRL